MGEEALKSFLQDLFEVCKKHDASITGCGCCQSPFGHVGAQDFDDLGADNKSAAFVVKIDGQTHTVEAK